MVKGVGFFWSYYGYVHEIGLDLFIKDEDGCFTSLELHVIHFDVYELSKCMPLTLAIICKLYMIKTY